jgi:hypothetical protein
MGTIVAHPYGALSLPVSSPAEREAQARDRTERLAALDPEQLPLALSFLIGYLLAAFDAALEAVELDPREKAPGVC